MKRVGFTLAEGLIASVVLAAAVIGIAGSLNASYQQSASQGETTTGLELARELMEEISSKGMDAPSGTTDQPGWSAGVTDRTKYDTIDDYDGYTDTSTSIQSLSGSTVDATNGQTYTRTVSVQGSAQPSGLTGTASDFSLVKVTVSTPHGQSVRLSQLFVRTNIQRSSG